MKKFLIRKLPACQDYKGRQYPACFGLTLVCSRGLRWDGGEYSTREEAVSVGERRTA